MNRKMNAANTSLIGSTSTLSMNMTALMWMILNVPKTTTDSGRFANHRPHRVLDQGNLELSRTAPACAKRTKGMEEAVVQIDVDMVIDEFLANHLVEPTF